LELYSKWEPESDCVIIGIEEEDIK
jgi:hypothetical protein